MAHSKCSINLRFHYCHYKLFINLPFIIALTLIFFCLIFKGYHYRSLMLLYFLLHFTIYSLHSRLGELSYNSLSNACIFWLSILIRILWIKIFAQFQHNVSIHLTYIYSATHKYLRIVFILFCFHLLGYVLFTKSFCTRHHGSNWII